MTWYSWLAMAVTATVLIGVAGNWLARWAGGRGWVYNKHNPRPPGGSTFRPFDEVFQPSIRHVIEEQSSEQLRAEDDESGAEPVAGGSSASPSEPIR